MKSSMFGMLAAGAVAGLVGSATLAGAGQTAGGGDAKACYRTQCGKSVKGHEGKCGGTKVETISDQQGCEGAGGAWTTETDAAKYKQKS
jgi:hypothetical protein